MTINIHSACGNFCARVQKKEVSVVSPEKGDIIFNFHTRAEMRLPGSVEFCERINSAINSNAHIVNITFLHESITMT